MNVMIIKYVFKNFYFNKNEKGKKMIDIDLLNLLNIYKFIIIKNLTQRLN